jgi:hypothetical protein
MAVPLHTPRVNNNDDVVRLLRVLVKRGDAVSAGDIVAEVETDKASHTVEADHPGFVLAVLPQVDDMIAVGSVLLWLGATPDDSVPESDPAEHPVLNPLPTVKAAQLLERYGLQAAEVQASDERVSARDVEEYVKVRGLKPIEADRQPSKEPGAVRRAPGTPHPLTPEELIARVYKEHRQDFEGFHVKFDNYYTTNSRENQDFCNDIYAQLEAKDLIAKRSVEQFYDPVKEMFLPDRFIKGECPNCHSKDQYGDSCEVCGTTYTPTDLINPYSVVSGAAPIRWTPRWRSAVPAARSASSGRSPSSSRSPRSSCSRRSCASRGRWSTTASARAPTSRSCRTCWAGTWNPATRSTT